MQPSNDWISSIPFCEVFMRILPRCLNRLVYYLGVSFHSMEYMIMANGTDNTDPAQDPILTGLIKKLPPMGQHFDYDDRISIIHIFKEWMNLSYHQTDTPIAVGTPAAPTTVAPPAPPPADTTASTDTTSTDTSTATASS